MGVNLCHLGRYDEAAELAKHCFEITEDSNNQLDNLRCTWLQARVLAGNGDYLLALNIYQIIRRDFFKLRMTYDLALVSVELAALLLTLGRARDCRALVEGLPAYFKAKGIHKEALSAIQILAESVSMETATESLARQVAAYLYRAQGNQSLRFVVRL
jgi:tetratricopeptide (TPR) repeat protein